MIKSTQNQHKSSFAVDVVKLKGEDRYKVVIKTYHEKIEIGCGKSDIRHLIQQLDSGII